MSEPAAGTLRPIDESALRDEIKRVLDQARAMIRDYNGLESQTDLTCAVLGICSDAVSASDPDARLREARRLVGERCDQLARAADRFGERDPVSIAAARALAQAAVDMLQDAIFDLRRMAAQPRGFGSLLKRQARSPAPKPDAGSRTTRISS